MSEKRYASGEVPMIGDQVEIIPTGHHADFDRACGRCEVYTLHETWCAMKSEHVGGGVCRDYRVLKFVARADGIAAEPESSPEDDLTRAAFDGDWESACYQAHEREKQFRTDLATAQELLADSQEREKALRARVVELQRRLETCECQNPPADQPAAN